MDVISPSPRLQFRSKADTLALIADAAPDVAIPPQRRCDWLRWVADRVGALAELAAEPWAGRARIVRSSAQAEDGAESSQAGRYRSIVVPEGGDLAAAIDAVFASYGDAPAAGDQMFVQPLLTGVVRSGVAFSRDPNSGGPYCVINAASGSDTAAVTSGAAAGGVSYWFRGGPVAPTPQDAPVVALLERCCALFGCDVDIEFAQTDDGTLWLLQARPLTGVVNAPDSDAERAERLTRIAKTVDRFNRPHPYLRGRRGVFGVMPDWNPAEIIGVRPRPLAYSLYADLVTNGIWAYQRSNYGYRNLRSFPLMLSFGGFPYIDVRVSFNSFIPAELSDGLAEKLVDHYVDRLIAHPHLHDKIEFDIVHSCYAFDLDAQFARLTAAGFSASEQEDLRGALLRLTANVMSSAPGTPFRADLARSERLDPRRKAVLTADLPKLAQIYWLLEDCKRYGTLPFAGLARAGFIAVRLLRSLAAEGVITTEQAAAFMAQTDTVTARMSRHLHGLSRGAFLELYGHLRPGAYDITAPRYDEAPDRYFDWSAAPAEPSPPPPCLLSLDQLRAIDALLRRHALGCDVVGLFDFIQKAIQGREQSKFVFTRSLSDALSIIAALGQEHGFSADDMSYASIDAITQLHQGAEDPHDALSRAIAAGRAAYGQMCGLTLPPLISAPEDVWRFEALEGEPNYVTQGVAEGPVVDLDAGDPVVPGCIVAIPSADPGFDWIFSRGVLGFVTAYGGVNSHMAIRAAELRLPAVIGAGETAFQRWRRARRLRLDCAARRVEALG